MLKDTGFNLSRPIIAIILLVSALALAAFSGALTKVLSASLSPFVTAWLRFTGSL